MSTALKKRILGVIPARYASTRFPGKPLADIAGQSMIKRVFRQASMASCLTEVVVATDDQRIFDEVNSFDGRAVMTSSQHTNGTSRCNEVLAKHTDQFDYVINIQGDEPLIDPVQIDQLASILDGNVQLGTLIKRIKNLDQLMSAAVVKTVVNRSNEAMYFSRHPIPFLQGKEVTNQLLFDHCFYKHIGIYAYRSDVLQEITDLPQTDLEKSESLEQLRWLESGYGITTFKTELESPSVDTPEDLAYIVKKLTQHQ